MFFDQGCSSCWIEEIFHLDENGGQKIDFVELDDTLENVFPALAKNVAVNMSDIEDDRRGETSFAIQTELNRQILNPLEEERRRSALHKERERDDQQPLPKPLFPLSLLPKGHWAASGEKTGDLQRFAGRAYLSSVQ